jgi:hypothetical protein
VRRLSITSCQGLGARADWINSYIVPGLGDFGDRFYTV